MEAMTLAELAADIEARQIDEVEDAGLMYLEYAELVRVAERGKARAKRQLGGFTGGVYGGIELRFERANREYPDVEAIRATYARLGLGPVPTKPAEPSPRVDYAEAAPNAEAA